jgi:CubicO group peptidase (beta-lactamase class C family)
MKAVEQLLRDAVGRVFPSAQLLVLDGGQVVLEQAAGDCDRDTLFDLASLTKPLCTATLVMRERLPLDARLRPGITVELALCHATGLPAWKLLGDSREAVLERVRAEPLERPPGSASVYSDLGFILLGAWLEAKLGPLDASFRRKIAPGLEIGFGPRAPERCAPTEGGLRGVVHDENARAMGGVAGHAGLFGHARDVAALVLSLLGDHDPRFWRPSGVPGSTWCLGWDRPSATGSSAGARWPRDGVGHLGFTGCSMWLDPPRGRAVILLSNRVHPSRANDRIKAFRPQLHDAVVEALDGPTRFG